VASKRTTEQTSKRTTHLLTGTRGRTNYNAAEQQFSCALQKRLCELVEGKRNRLMLLRRYSDQAERLGVMVTPAELPRDQLRLPIVEGMIWDAVSFLSPNGSGGPVSQETAPDGRVVEFQMFSTKFPHIVVERTDCYVGEGSIPAETTWSLRRVQNQREQTQLNRLLDAANLAIEFFRIVR
jgi:hypothetical protein